MDIISRIRKEQKNVEKKISTLQKELSKLTKAGDVLKGVQRKVSKQTAAARKKMSLAAKRRWRKIKRGAAVATS